MSAFELSPEDRHRLAVRLNGLVWSLLEKSERTSKDDGLLESAALGSMYHWHHSPHFKAINVQRGHWILSRVYAVLERADDALEHAVHCATWTSKSAVEEFVRASAGEAHASALAAKGER